MWIIFITYSVYIILFVCIGAVILTGKTSKNDCRLQTCNGLCALPHSCWHFGSLDSLQVLVCSHVCNVAISRHSNKLTLKNLIFVLND